MKSSAMKFMLIYHIIVKDFITDDMLQGNRNSREYRSKENGANKRFCSMLFALWNTVFYSFSSLCSISVMFS
jgi:hypothetical protein